MSKRTSSVRWLEPEEHVNRYDARPRSAGEAVNRQRTTPDESALVCPRPALTMGAPDGYLPEAPQIAPLAVLAVSAPNCALVTSMARSWDSVEPPSSLTVTCVTQNQPPRGVAAGSVGRGAEGVGVRGASLDGAGVGGMATTTGTLEWLA